MKKHRPTAEIKAVNMTRDVITGRLVKNGTGHGKRWASKRGLLNWWTTQVFSCSKPSDIDGHIYEVCLYNVGHHHQTPTWPILAFYDAETAMDWERKLRKAAKNWEADESKADHFSKEVNGDTRVAAFLAENGFEKFNYIWWKQKEAPTP